MEDRDNQRGVGLQVAIAGTAGLTVLVTFSIWRRRWPRMYAARTYRRQDLPSLPQNSLFGWLGALYRISEEQILEFAGLDAYVVLMFFRAATDILLRMTLVSILVIGPLRLWYTGKFDHDEPRSRGDGDDLSPIKQPVRIFQNFHWTYVVFTFVFTILSLSIFNKYTSKVIQVRQYYLGSQNAITDRTLRISGIPRDKRDSKVLTDYIEDLNIGKVRSVVLCHDWTALDRLCSRRKALIKKLEAYWAQMLGPTFVNNLPQDQQLMEVPEVYPERNEATGETVNYVHIYSHQEGRIKSVARPRGHADGLFWKPKVDLIQYYTDKLTILDEKIRAERSRNNLKTTSTAFLSLDSVSSAQMGAQAVLYPAPDTLLSHLAPAPHDVIWRNVYLSPIQRALRSYVIMIACIVATAFISIPFSYIATLLKFETIKKFAPWLAGALKNTPTLKWLVTETLPPLLLTLLNLGLPYLYWFLSQHQGFVSREDVELSTVSKNFFYIFVNFFLVLTAATNYMQLLQDTTTIPVKLAEALQSLSTLYTNFIVLQGLLVTPARLLQVGSVLQVPWSMARCQSPRDYHNLFKPAELNYGILLPTAIFVFMMVILYSVLSVSILFFGTIYFVMGYFVYKYQFMYSMVHPQHSTGKIWILIAHRFYLGLVLFQLAMAGILVLQSSYSLSLLLAPLPVVTCAYSYYFEKFSRPLLEFIALQAVVPPRTELEQDVEIPMCQDVSLGDLSDNEDTLEVEPLIQRLRRGRSRTLDEGRELHHKYVNSNSISVLDGPWIGVEGDVCVVANPEGLVRRTITYEDWD